MNEQTAKALAAALDGQAMPIMPSSRSWGALLTRPDGSLVAIEGHAGRVYRDRDAYESYHRSGNPEGVVDAAEWPSWGVTELWATSLSRLLGGEGHQSGGNIWVVFYERPDRRFIVIGDDGADIYESADHYERYYEAGQPEPEFVNWSE
jgi:hypothetical protein